jgi:PAS domain S-box-containing protein
MSTAEPTARARYFERLTAPLWAVDDHDRTIDVNPALVEALGYSVEEMMGRSPAEFLTEESRATYRAQSILRRSGMSDTFNCTFRRKDGSTRTYRVSGSPIFDGDRYVGKIAVLRDVPVWNGATGSASPEAASTGETTAGPAGTGDPGWDDLRELSHDLRNPLQAILGFAELLQRGAPPLDSEQASHVDMIAQAARDALERLARLDAARARAGRRQED